MQISMWSTTNIPSLLGKVKITNFAEFLHAHTHSVHMSNGNKFPSFDSPFAKNCNSEKETNIESKKERVGGWHVEKCGLVR